MATVEDVNPESFIDVSNDEPEHGRGAWTREGIGFDYRYVRAPKGEKLLGSECETSLAHWAVGAGVRAIQRRLAALRLGPEGGFGGEYNVYGQATMASVKRFQEKNVDPANGQPLWIDGIIGRSDSRALWTPLIDQAEEEEQIPDRLLLGQINHESLMDAGAVGYYIFYADPDDPENLEYRGVDRGLAMMNSKALPNEGWLDVFSPRYAINWTANRMKSQFDSYREDYPKRRDSVLWDAAVCAHNSPLWGGQWAKNGAPPNEQAARYVAAVKTAVY